jgi:OTU domain-containing protein 5
VTEDFDKYVTRKRRWNVHGNHLEIQAMSELYNRTIEVYCYQISNTIFFLAVCFY